MSTKARYLCGLCLLLPITLWVELFVRDASMLGTCLRLYVVGVSIYLGWSIKRWTAALVVPALAVALGLAGLLSLSFRGGDDWWELLALKAFIEFGATSLFGAVLGLWIADNFPGKSPVPPAATDVPPPS